MITLYHAPQSRSSRMIWLLEELGVPYAIEPVSIFRPMTGEGVPDAAQPHPDKRVPALLHNGVLVAESLAIVLHLAEHFPEAGLGAGDRRPRSRRIPDLAGLVSGRVRACPVLRHGGRAPGIAAEAPRPRGGGPPPRNRLARGPYAMGERFSGADILIASALGFGPRRVPGQRGLRGLSGTLPGATGRPPRCGGTVPPVFSRVPRAPSAEADAGSVEGPAPEGRTEPAPRRRAARCGLRRPSPRRRCAGRPPPRVFQDTPDLNA